MTCPTCNGPLSYLFTSSYCPRCEAKEDVPAAAETASKPSAPPEWSISNNTWTLTGSPMVRIADIGES